MGYRYCQICDSMIESEYYSQHFCPFSAKAEQKERDDKLQRDKGKLKVEYTKKKYDLEREYDKKTKDLDEAFKTADRERRRYEYCKICKSYEDKGHADNEEIDGYYQHCECLEKYYKKIDLKYERRRKECEDDLERARNKLANMDDRSDEFTDGSSY